MRLHLLAMLCCFVAIAALRGQQTSVCTKARNIACDFTYKDSTDFETSLSSNYQCSEGGVFAARERVYKFTLSQPRNIFISLQIAEAGVDLDLFLLGSCVLSADACLAYSNTGTRKEQILQSLEAGTYYIVVDAKQADAVGTYRLKLTCADNICQRSTSSISCGEYKVKENLENTLNLIAEYPNCLNKVYSGREKIYALELSPGSNIQAGLHVDTSSKKDFDLFLVQVDETCYEITCLAQASVSAIKGSKSLFSNQLGSGTYYLIVDSQEFYTSGEFSLDVSCGGVPCNGLTALNCSTPTLGTTTTAARDRSKVSLYRVRQENAVEKFYPGHSGPEKFYSFEVLEPQNVTLKVSQPGELRPKDLSLFVLKNCDNLEAVGASVTKGSGSETLTVFLNPGIYYAVVDQLLGADAYKFSLELQFTQACTNICDYGGAFISRGTFSNELSRSEVAPILLYEEQCVKDAFSNFSSGSKRLYADVFLFNNEESQSPISLTLNASNGTSSIRGFIFQCDYFTAKTNCLGFTQNGNLDLGPSATGFYYVVILDSQNTPYTFSITPKGVCESNPEAIPLNTNITRSVSGKNNDFSIGGSGYNGYSNCYSGARTYQGEDVEFQFTVPSNVLVNISFSSKAAMGLFLYGYSCGKGCLDYTQTSIEGGSGEIKDFPLNPGTYYLIVDKNDLATENAEFSLSINTRPTVASPFFLAYDPINSNCVPSKRKGHSLEILKKAAANLLTASDRFYIFPEQLSPQARAIEKNWDPISTEEKMKMDELRMDSLGDAQKCGFRDRDSIYIILETNDKDQQFIQEVLAEYVSPSPSNAVSAKGQYKPGGVSLIQAFRFIRPRHFSLNTRQLIINPNENIIQSISIKTNVRFRVKMEPAVDYIKILNPQSIYPAEASEIKLSIIKNSSGKPRDLVKLIFTSADSPEYRSEVLLLEKQCIPFTASIVASEATTLCPGSSITLSASVNNGSLGDYLYSWSNGSTAASIELQDLKTGSSQYTLTVTPKDESVCEVKPLTQNITVLARPNAPVAVKSEVGVCTGQLVPLLSVAPQAGVSTNWYNGANELLPAVDAIRFLPRVNQPGVYTYYVEAQSTAGCISENRTPITLTIYPAFTLAADPVEKNVSCKGASDGIVNIRINETGYNNLNYRWSDGGTGSRRTDLKAGAYQVTLNSGSGCAQEFSAVLTEPDSLKIVVKSIKADTSAKNTGAVEVIVNGGIPPYRYNWIKAEQSVSTAQNLTMVSSGNYQLELRDQNQCVLFGPVVAVPKVVLSSITEQPLAARIFVYPNPTDGLINITFDLPENMEIRPEILNAFGEVVQKLPPQQMLKGNLQTLLPGVESGIYFIQIGFPGGVVVKRVLLIRG
ncbi:MAG: pre-peptidase C-terminal domain-containing protein [Haliscomenobacter sp.]|uniref:pre-peptidase C-terminal domain-containing protein n=1 Tax=Haliscomenobacter sp. TaxID=2717303 RepID=UPI0029B458B4|nr:pre-peptidase C-terminal domain-containing protein [Haliscomenobacter sp.]MDX2072004.1 pre-peptidase C-terminal domain-containing protein [Haliscomenobacter sp.]